jgi:hypothetical protein
MNKNDLIAHINAAQNSDFISGDTEYFSETDNQFYGEIEVCSQESDYEDGYNHVEVVYHFPKWECHVQMNGYYASHNGYEFTDCCLVEPEVYTAVRYNKI